MWFDTKFVWLEKQNFSLSLSLTLCVRAKEKTGKSLSSFIVFLLFNLATCLSTSIDKSYIGEAAAAAAAEKRETFLFESLE